MIDALTMLLGPLAAPECSRASRRGWLIWVRLLPALGAGAVAFITMWYWSIGHLIDQYYQPFNELRIAIIIIEGLMVAFALIMTPAVLAGSLAGEKERGSIGLLLTTRVNCSEIVLGRLAGRLSQVTMIELASVPPLLLMAWMAGFGPSSTLMLLALPASVALGGSGIALAASAMSKRGRDALLFVYLVEILFLLSPLLGSLGVSWIGALSPFETMPSLAWREEMGPSLITAGSWASMGVIGLVLASWRLRASCLTDADGALARRRGRAKRRAWVPPMDDDRPMLWKELYIERVGTLGGAGRWVGGLLVVLMAGGSIGLGGLVTWGYFSPAGAAWASWATQQSAFFYGNSAIVIGCLIQWTIGLRAAVTISSERERGTWDALLTSPLEGLEIVRGKLWGSLWALKWLVGSALLAWTITFAIGGMFWPEYAELLIGLVVVGTFMAAIGVRTSLMSSTATKAMGITIGLWLLAWVAAFAVACVVCSIVGIVCFIGWQVAMMLGLIPLKSLPWFPMGFRFGRDITMYSQFVAAVFVVVADTRLRFDRVAGRMTEGKSAIAIDRLIYGTPMAPVLLEADSSPRKVAKMRAGVKWRDEIAT